MNGRAHLLVAEDDSDDFEFLREVLIEKYPALSLVWMKDGNEVVQYLKGPDNETPRLMILDLNMPKKDGREILKEIKMDPVFADLRVIVFTTSNSPADRVYVNSFKNTSLVTKPIGYANYIAFVESLKKDL